MGIVDRFGFLRHFLVEAPECLGCVATLGRVRRGGCLWRCVRMPAVDQPPGLGLDKPERRSPGGGESGGGFLDEFRQDHAAHACTLLGDLQVGACFPVGHRPLPHGGMQAGDEPGHHGNHLVAMSLMVLTGWLRFAGPRHMSQASVVLSGAVTSGARALTLGRGGPGISSRGDDLSGTSQVRVAADKMLEVVS